MININKKYRTRSGRSVRFICRDKCGEEPVIIGMCPTKMFINDPSPAIEEPAAWYVFNGQWVGGQGVPSDFDLVEINPYQNWPIDALVWSRTVGGDWHRRHFAGVDENGNPMAWENGLTSWTTDIKLDWHEMHLASEFTPGNEK